MGSITTPTRDVQFDAEYLLKTKGAWIVVAIAPFGAPQGSGMAVREFLRANWHLVAIGVTAATRRPADSRNSEAVGY